MTVLPVVATVVMGAMTLARAAGKNVPADFFVKKQRICVAF
jgi:hypothetical protein